MSDSTELEDEDSQLRDLRLVIEARIAAIVLEEILTHLEPAMKKKTYSPLGLRSGKSRYDEDDS